MSLVVAWVAAEFSANRGGIYRFWLRGSVRGGAQASVDGLRVGTVDGQLAGAGEYTELGAVRLGLGLHRLRLHNDSKDLSPGTATPPELPYPSGPLIVSSAPEDPEVVDLAPAQARELCGKSLNWVEVVDK